MCHPVLLRQSLNNTGDAFETGNKIYYLANNRFLLTLDKTTILYEPVAIKDVPLHSDATASVKMSDHEQK